jgi:hygromycin-B 7''-O-kinase
MGEHTDADHWLHDAGYCLELARRVCRQHHLSGECARIGNETQAVFAVDTHTVIKFFAPTPADAFENETTFLRGLCGQLPIRTPELYAAGHLDGAPYSDGAPYDGAPYIVMEYLPGVALDHLWETLSSKDKCAILSQLGEAVRALHALSTEAFRGAACDWRVCIEQQREHLCDHHRAFGLDDVWAAQLPAYVNGLTIDLHDPAHLVPLHTELMPEHIFLTPTDAGWQVSGLIDFEPAMVGRREYEFGAVAVFLSQGNSALLRAFLRAYGYTNAELTPAFGRQLMIGLLLHRYCNLNWFLSLIPAERRGTTLGQLEEFWFGV